MYVHAPLVNIRRVGSMEVLSVPKRVYVGILFLNENRENIREVYTNTEHRKYIVSTIIFFREKVSRRNKKRYT